MAAILASMLTPSEALARILARISAPLRTERVSLGAAHGRCLAARALSDVDLPPFEKSMMDGFALRSASLAAGGGRLRMMGEARAGLPFSGAVPGGSCVEIFTGAELPTGCDAVEMIEHVRREGEFVVFALPVKPGQNVAHLGEILRASQVAYEPRRRLSAADLSVLASVGVDPVTVFARPRVSILTTGDELVGAREKPGRGQIREGNTFFLRAACEALGCEVVRSGIVPDEPARLELAFGQALEDSDVLVTTGGVSVGKYDLVGATLERLGVEPVLHKVAVKPGKPIWFGLSGAKPVFGLPGNPVSTLLGFEVFVRAALVRLSGDDPALERERILRGRWTGRPEKGSDRQNNLPARVRQAADGVSELEPIPFRGSADIVAAARADALAIVPAGGEIQSGQLIEYRPL
ncbi:MAG: molybdopterin molybdotransferase MoeA [Planctomycetes bacterium]|nr:molybdopterin molybdotransferase MoeA [Planctomycetota bacterium]